MTATMEATEAALTAGLQERLESIHINACLDHELSQDAQRKLWLEADWVENVANQAMREIRRKAQHVQRQLTGSPPAAAPARKTARKTVRGGAHDWFRPRENGLSFSPRGAGKEHIEWFLPISPAASTRDHRVTHPLPTSPKDGILPRGSSFARSGRSPPSSTGDGSVASPNGCYSPSNAVKLPLKRDLTEQREEEDLVGVDHLKREGARIDALKVAALGEMEATGILPFHIVPSTVI